MHARTQINLLTFLFWSVIPLFCISCSDGKDPVHPIVGKWKRNFYQIKDLPVTHKRFENLMLPSPYVPDDDGLYLEESYELTFNGDHTFSRLLIFSNVSAYSDKGTWEIRDTELVIDSDKSDKDETYVLHSNSGTALAFYQKRKRLLLPDAVMDTLDFNTYLEHQRTLLSKYGEVVELKIYFFFEREE